MGAYDLDQRTTPEVVTISKASNIAIRWNYVLEEENRRRRLSCRHDGGMVGL